MSLPRPTSTTGIVEVSKKRTSRAFAASPASGTAASAAAAAVAAQVEDPEIDAIEAQLNAIPRFEPLIRSSIEAPGFNWGSLFSSSSRRKETPFDISGEPLETIITKMRRHSTACALSVADNQKILGDRINGLDEYTGKLVSTVSTHVYQARQHVDALSKMTAIKKYAETTKNLLLDIRSSLVSLNQFLDSGERLEHPENARSLPLPKLYQRLDRIEAAELAEIEAIRRRYQAEADRLRMGVGPNSENAALTR
ncbi:hypothetical protein HK405_011762, partial [Cladochytrium tenue]